MCIRIQCDVMVARLYITGRNTYPVLWGIGSGDGMGWDSGTAGMTVCGTTGFGVAAIFAEEVMYP